MRSHSSVSCQADGRLQPKLALALGRPNVDAMVPSRLLHDTAKRGITHRVAEEALRASAGYFSPAAIKLVRRRSGLELDDGPAMRLVRTAGHNEQPAKESVGNNPISPCKLRELRVSALRLLRKIGTTE